MRKLFVIIIAVAAVALLAGLSVTGYMVLDEEEDVIDVKPEAYKSDVVETGSKTVCSEGDSVKIYNVKKDGILKTWSFIEEVPGPVEVKASFSAQKGYECYKSE